MMCVIIISCILQSLTITTLPDGTEWASSGWALWPLAGTVFSKGVLVSQTAHSLYFTQTQSLRPTALHISGAYLQGRPTKTPPFIKLKNTIWLCRNVFFWHLYVFFIAIWHLCCLMLIPSCGLSGNILALVGYFTDTFVLCQIFPWLALHWHSGRLKN